MSPQEQPFISYNRIRSIRFVNRFGASQQSRLVFMNLPDNRNKSAKKRNGRSSLNSQKLSLPAESAGKSRRFSGEESIWSSPADFVGRETCTGCGGAIEVRNHLTGCAISCSRIDEYFVVPRPLPLSRAEPSVNACFHVFRPCAKAA